MSSFKKRLKPTSHEKPSIKLPSLLKPAQSILNLSDKLQKTNPLISYLTGIYAVQISLDLGTSKNHEISTEEELSSLHSTLSTLISQCEVRRQKILSSASIQGIESGSSVEDYLNWESSDRAKFYLSDYVGSLFLILTQQIKDGNCDGESVGLFLDVAGLYEVFRGLFSSVESFDEEDSIQDTNKVDTKQQTPESEGFDQNESVPQPEKDIASKSNFDDDSKPIDVEDTKMEEAEHISNIQETTNEKKCQSKNKHRDLTTSQISERITYCKFQATRILNLIKLDINPNGDIQDYRLPDEPIPQKEIDDVLKHVMDMPDDAYDSDSDNECDDYPRVSAFELPSIPSDLPVAKPKDHTDEEKCIEYSDTNEEKSVDERYNTNNENQNGHNSFTKESLQEYLKRGELLEAAQNSAKLAISALNYEDDETALKKLLEAVDLIKEYNIRKNA